jgi:hypothetical protein
MMLSSVARAIWLLFMRPLSVISRRVGPYVMGRGGEWFIRVSARCRVSRSMGGLFLCRFVKVMERIIQSGALHWRRKLEML